MKKLKSTQRRLVVVVAVAGVLMMAAAVAYAVTQTGQGKLDRFAFAQDPSLVDNDDPTYVEVPGMQVRVNTKGARTNAVARFCVHGNMFGTGTGSTWVQFHVDDQPAAPGVQILTFHDDATVPRCFEWVLHLGPGDHTVNVLWKVQRIPGSDLTGRFHNRVFTVSY